MLDRIKKDIAGLRGADPLTALTDLSAWLEAAKGTPGEALRGEILSLIQEASGAHLSALLAQIIAKPAGLHAEIAILGRDSQAVQLRVVSAEGEEDVFSEATAREFDFNRVRAIILADRSDSSAAAQRPNLLVPPESWKEGRVYEAAGEGAARYLRSVQLRQRGDDYVRATFEWMSQS